MLYKEIIAVSCGKHKGTVGHNVEFHMFVHTYNHQLNLDAQSFELPTGSLCVLKNFN
jgi:hypothetical protein